MSGLVADIQNTKLAPEQKRALLEAAVTLQLPLSGDNDADKETILYAGERIDGIMSGQKYTSEETTAKSIISDELSLETLLIKQDYLDKQTKKMISHPENIKFSTNALILQLFKHYAKKIKPSWVKAGVDKHEYYLKLYEQIRNSFIKAQEVRSQSAESSLERSSATQDVATPQPQVVVQPEPQKREPEKALPVIEKAAPFETVSSVQPLQPKSEPVAQKEVAIEEQKKVEAPVTQPASQPEPQKALPIQKPIDPEALKIVNELVKTYAQSIQNQIVERYENIYTDALEAIKDNLIANTYFANKIDEEVAELVITSINDNMEFIVGKKDKLTEVQQDSITKYFKTYWPKKALPEKIEPPVAVKPVPKKELVPEKPISPETIKFAEKLVAEYKEGIATQIIDRPTNPYRDAIDDIVGKLLKQDTSLKTNRAATIADLIINACIKSELLLNDSHKEFIKKTVDDYDL